MDNVAQVKDLMYATGMTRLEAEAYLACTVEGVAVTEYARRIGRDHTLISQRVRNARIKAWESGEDIGKLLGAD